MLVLLVSVAVCAGIIWIINQQFKATEPSLLTLTPPEEIGGTVPVANDPIVPTETQIASAALQLDETPKKGRKKTAKKAPKKATTKPSIKVKKPRTRKPKA